MTRMPHRPRDRLAGLRLATVMAAVLVIDILVVTAQGLQCGPGGIALQARDTEAVQSAGLPQDDAIETVHHPVAPRRGTTDDRRAAPVPGPGDATTRAVPVVVNASSHICNSFFNDK